MTIGILGGGQLGYMLALAGYPLNFHFRFLDPSPQAPVGRIAPRVTAEYTDFEALEKFASGLTLVTYEFENVPVEAARFLQERLPVHPSPQALEVAQDRRREKKLFQELGIPTTEFAAVDSPEELVQAVRKLGLPAILKTCRFGYDGKGQWLLRTQDDASRIKKEIPAVPLVLDKFVNFSRELSILAVRGRNGKTAFYPLVENRHREGILRLSLAPAPRLTVALQKEAEQAAIRILESLDYVGVLAIELFECDGRLLANEMAPRVHNSGHWSIEGAITSQFENHLRAVTGLALGDTQTIGHCAMLNLIGELPDSSELLAVPDAHLHIYGKALRPGRKVGHVTVRADSADQLASRLEQLPQFFHREGFCLSPDLVHSAK
jgi:5-(carboxyamino)imidazole ribonucleotide synthase